jgi:hypothetical protein
VGRILVNLGEGVIVERLNRREVESCGTEEREREEEDGLIA